MVRGLTISMLLAAVFLSGCSGAKTAEQVALEERNEILRTMPSKFTIPTDSAISVRNRFRTWVRCWGDYPISTDTEGLIETAWPSEGVTNRLGLRVSLVANGSTTRVSVEGSDPHDSDLDRLALYLRDGLVPIASWFEPCEDPVFHSTVGGG